LGYVTLIYVRLNWIMLNHDLFGWVMLYYAEVHDLTGGNFVFKYLLKLITITLLHFHEQFHASYYNHGNRNSVKT